MSGYVEEAVCRERQRVQEERFARDRERLEKGEQKIDTLEKAVVYLTEVTKQAREDIAEHDERLDTLEHRPGAISEKIWLMVVSAVISGVVAVLINLVF